MEPNWLTWAKELQSIAQAGLTYSKDKFDIERFEQIRNISLKILAKQTSMDKMIIKDLFANETGYATPKVDIRAVVFQEDKILMVRENMDNKWALPGGWADIGLSPGQVAVKEVNEESGFKVKPIKLLAVLDKKYHPHPPSAYHVYKMFIQCEIVSGEPQIGLETNQVDFFAENELPELSIARNTKSQLSMLFDYLKNPEKPVAFD
ncbi:NUDIX hydrolase [Paucisalibacillus globulus]|uniref:NUDIX hydrolase n=1 Tax=Paucisalibacillus globulus TaxID=351095 RepID=UPI00042905DB|nr:NUDIX hydrolase [Paucisalibacillus globulus]